MRLLITGSGGLVGNQIARFFLERGFYVIGIENNSRKIFFGQLGDISENINHLVSYYNNYNHYNADIRDQESIKKIIIGNEITAIIHCAAQPSHDKASEIPFIDFEINALGTLNLLEIVRKYSVNTNFILLSTNKVYGDNPNRFGFKELNTRYDFLDSRLRNGFDENLSIDNCLHSLYGASKLAADIYTQEYARYFNLKTTILRCSCITGNLHKGVELHGFLFYLCYVAKRKKTYQIFGYKGKQVRDQIHSYDLAEAIFEIINRPTNGEIFNIGGGRSNSISILEAICKIERKTGLKIKKKYISQNRKGDHICYITDVSKFTKHYPNWRIKYDIDKIFNNLLFNKEY